MIQYGIISVPYDGSHAVRTVLQYSRTYQQKNFDLLFRLDNKTRNSLDRLDRYE